VFPLGYFPVIPWAVFKLVNISSNLRRTSIFQQEKNVKNVRVIFEVNAISRVKSFVEKVIVTELVKETGDSFLCSQKTSYPEPVETHPHLRTLFL
jgi:hypothetical protein